jgi:hypothetical protein
MVKLNKLASIFIISIIMLSGLIPLINAPVLPGTYYGNFTHATEITSIGIVRKWLVYNETVLFDEQTSSYFTKIDYGDGSYSSHTDNSLSIYYNGIKSLSIQQNAGSSSDLQLEHGSLSLAITSYDYLSIYVYPVSNTNQIELYYLDSGATYSAYITSIANTWNEIKVDIIGVNPLNRVGIHALIDNYYLDYLTLKTNSYYEVWDGATLKYQSTIEPDIFDFVQQPTLIDSTVNVPGIISVSEVDNPVITFNTWLIILFAGLIFAILSTQIRIHIMALLPLVMTCWGIINWNMYPNIILLNCIIWVLTLLFSIVAISEI